MSPPCPLLHFEMLFFMVTLCVLLPQPALQTTASNKTAHRGPSQPSPLVKLIPSKPQTSSQTAKLSSQNTLPSSKLNQDPTSSNRSLSIPPKPSLPISHRASGDASPSSSQHTVKVLISDTCVHRDVQGDKANQTKDQGHEVTLQEGSPVILTQKISLIPASCSEGCGEQFVALQTRLERLEKELSMLRKKYDDADGMCCPSQPRKERECLNDCSDQGRCEGGECICFTGFGGPDCSSATCPSQCHERGACVDGQCVCESGYAGPDCSVKSCPNDCNRRGRCIQGACDCDAGFLGIDCADKSCPGNCNSRGRCLRGKCLCDPGFVGLDCSKCEAGFTGADCVSVVPGGPKIIKVNVETVTLKVAPGADKTTRKTPGRTKLDKAILSNEEEETQEALRKIGKEKVSVEKDNSSKTKADSSLKLGTGKTTSKKELDVKSSSTKLYTNTESDVKSDSATTDKTGDSDSKVHVGTEKSAPKLDSARKSESHTKDNEGTGTKSGDKITLKSPVIANGTRIVQGHKRVVEALLKQPEIRRQEDSKVDMKHGPTADVKPDVKVKVESEQDSKNRTLPKSSTPLHPNKNKTSDSAKQIQTTAEGKMAPEQTFSRTEPRRETAEQILHSKNKTKSSGEKPLEKEPITHGSKTKTDSKTSKSQRNATATTYKPGSALSRTDGVQSTGTASQPTEPQRNTTAIKDGQGSGYSRTGLAHINGTVDKPIKLQRNMTAKDGGHSGFSRSGFIQTNGTAEKPAAPQSNTTVSKLGEKSDIGGKDAVHRNGTVEKHPKLQRNATILKEVRGSAFKKATAAQVNKTTDKTPEVRRNVTVKDHPGPGYRRPGVIHTNGTAEQPKEPQKNITLHRHSPGSIILRTGIHTNGTSEKAKEARRNITVFTEGQGVSPRRTGVISTNGTADKPKEPGRNITIFTKSHGSTLRRTGAVSTNKTDSSTLLQTNKTVKNNMKTGTQKGGISTGNQTEIDRSSSSGNNTAISKGVAAVKLNRTVSLKTMSEKGATSADHSSKMILHHHSVAGQSHNGTDQRGPQHEPLKTKGQSTEGLEEESHVVMGKQHTQEARGNTTATQLDLATKTSLQTQVRRKTSSSTETSHNATSSQPVDPTKVNMHRKLRTGPSVPTNRSSASRTPPILGSVRVQNVTSKGFVLTWEAPQGVFKNFTVTMIEYLAESGQETEEENEKDGKYKEDDEEKPKSGAAFSQKNTGEGDNDSKTMTRSEDVNAGSNVRKLSVVLGSTRSLAFRNLRPQTRYSLSLYGINPGTQPKIHHLTVTTAPEPPTELLFDNVTDSSLSVSWTKPRSPVTGFTVTYTNTDNGTPVSLEVEPQLSSVVLSQLDPGSSYEVSVTARQGLDRSDPVTGLVVTVPDPPTALKAVNVTDTQAVLQWVRAVAAVDRYVFVYGSGGGTRLTTVVSGEVAELHLKGLQRATKYTVTASSQRYSLRSTTVDLTFTTTGGQAHTPAGERFPLPVDCSQLLLNGVLHSGEALIYPGSKQDRAVRVFCDMETDGGGWTVFQRRMNGKTNFFRTWDQYSKGFGNLSGEFWLGNELIHSLTSSRPMMLRVDLRAGVDTAYATYSSFHVAPQRKNYTLRVSGYSGTAGDSMKYHNGQLFSTRDKDLNPVLSGCARSYRGGWWYKDCHEANLNGLYDINTNHQGVIWTAWKGKNFSIPFTEMKLRPVAFNPQTQG